MQRKLKVGSPLKESGRVWIILTVIWFDYSTESGPLVHGMNREKILVVVLTVVMFDQMGVWYDPNCLKVWSLNLWTSRSWKESREDFGFGPNCNKVWPSGSFEMILTVGKFVRSICGPLVHWRNREGILVVVLTVGRFDQVGGLKRS